MSTFELNCHLWWKARHFPSSGFVFPVTVAFVEMNVQIFVQEMGTLKSSICHPLSGLGHSHITAPAVPRSLDLADAITPAQDTVVLYRNGIIPHDHGVPDF